MNQETVLVVEDEVKIANMLKRALEYDGFHVLTVPSGEDALLIMMKESIDIVLLDIMLPGLQGWEVAREIREDNPLLPIIMLTAKDEIEDRVRGLGLGADDYVVKPFALEELLARIKAQLRKKRLMEPESSGPLTFHDLQVDPATFECFRNKRKVDLKGKEFDLLVYFMRHPNQILSKDSLLEHIWGVNHPTESNVIEVYIASLRSKLENQGEPRLLQTVRNKGYVLKAD